MAQPKMLAVVPCYNEAARLPREDFRRFMADHPQCQFLFVDDGSTDATFQVLENLAKDAAGRAKILKLEKNFGKAEAVRRGFLEGFQSGFDLLAFWDADLATPLDVLPRFLKLFEDRPDLEIVLGARVKLLGHDVRRRPVRHYLGRIFATGASMVLSLPVYDTQCGAKMFRPTETVKGIFREPFISKWIFDVELFARYLKAKKKNPAFDPEKTIYEMALPAWKDIRGSKVKGRDFLNAAWELFEIWRSYR